MPKKKLKKRLVINDSCLKTEHLSLAAASPLFATVFVQSLVLPPHYQMSLKDSMQEVQERLISLVEEAKGEKAKQPKPPGRPNPHKIKERTK